MNDVINSGGGIDVIDGGGGSSWGADLSFATDDIVIDLNGPSTFLGSGRWSMSRLRRLTTGSATTS